MKINYAAIVVSAVAYWLLGALWYGFLFNKAWMALEQQPVQATSLHPVLPYIITFVLNLLIAFILAQICGWRNANTAARGAALGILLWIGFVGPVTFTTYMYEMRSMQLYAINEFFALVGFCLMGAILGAWTKKAA
jgi:surface polysaccharide O-acyltransferase-like enzyme